MLDCSLLDPSINKNQRQQQPKQQMPPDVVELNSAGFNLKAAVEQQSNKDAKDGRQDDTKHSRDRQNFEILRQSRRIAFGVKALGAPNKIVGPDR